MMLADILWGAPQWLAPAATLAAIALLVLVWGYWRAPASRSVRVAAALLKTIALLTIAACLLEPLHQGVRARPGANLFVLLADDSKSMQIRDRGASESRGERLRRQLTSESSWPARLGRDFDVRRYAFDTRLRSLASFSDLAFQGGGSSVIGALRTVADRFEGRPLAGVLLLTDGIVPDPPENAAYGSLPPVYPVPLADEPPARDIGIRQVAVSQTNFEEAPVTIQVELTAHGYQGRSVIVELLDDSGKSLQQQTMKAPADGRAAQARFQLRPEGTGLRFYRVRALAKEEFPERDQPDRTAEATRANNSRLVTVDRGGGPYRVLYICGRPNWEFKFLRRAVADDEEIRLVGLLRLARKEPKFDFRGRVGETTNPLYRGFGNQEDEEAEQYDQPVLLRLDTRDDEELRKGFPGSAEELFRYHALILDDVEAAFFSHDEMSLIQEFVSRRGGALLMLGGQESFEKGKYRHSPLEELLPVYLDAPGGDPAPRGYRLSLTREGWLQPWVRLRRVEAEEKQRLDAMPAFQTVHRLKGVKPGAAVLASVQDESGKTFPALAAQRYGKGRAAALMIGDLWRWSLERKPNNPLDIEKAWRQTVRWLTADVPQRIECEIRRKEEGPSRTLHLAVQVLDAEYKPLDNASVKLDIASPDGGRLEVKCDPSSQRAGLYEAAYAPRRAGAYRARILATGPDGTELPPREIGWTSEPDADEFQTLQPNPSLLARLAEETGGEIAPPERLEQFVAGLPRRKAPITEPWIHPLWHQPLAFLFAIACLIAECGLRRWKGLP